MANIMPITELGRRFNEADAIVSGGAPVFLTGGVKPMVLISMDTYSLFTDDIDTALAEADAEAASGAPRMTHEEVFGDLRRKFNVAQTSVQRTGGADKCALH